MKVAAGVDEDHLAGHGLGAAHRDHQVGAVVLVGGLFQQRRGGVPSALRCGPRIVLLRSLGGAVDVSGPGLARRPGSRARS
jgi:hypothetical protein